MRKKKKNGEGEKVWIFLVNNDIILIDDLYPSKIFLGLDLKVNHKNVHSLNLKIGLRIFCLSINIETILKTLLRSSTK